jgi:hypothetical protein
MLRGVIDICSRPVWRTIGDGPAASICVCGAQPVADTTVAHFEVLCLDEVG